MKNLIFTITFTFVSFAVISQVSSVTVNNNTSCDFSIRIYGSDNDYTCFDSGVPCVASACIDAGNFATMSLPTGCSFIHYCAVQERHACVGTPSCVSTSAFASINGCMGYSDSTTASNSCFGVSSCGPNTTIVIGWTNQSIINIY